MYKIVILMFISNAVLINTQKEKEYQHEENYVTTETYHTSYQEVPVVESNEDHETDFIITESEQSGHVPNNIIIPSISESYDDVETEIKYTPNLNAELDVSKAEAEIKAWTEHLDCSTSSLSPFKCTMVKKIAKRFFEHAAGINYKKLVAQLKAAIKKLEDGETPMDTEMRNLIQKYKKYLFMDQVGSL